MRNHFLRAGVPKAAPSTAWDINRDGSDIFLGANQNFKDLDSLERDPHHVRFKTDGTKMFVLDLLDRVSEYTLTTAWDVSTAGSFVEGLNLNSQSTDNKGFTFKTDGTKLYAADDKNNRISQYNLSTAWDTTSGSYSQSFSVSSQDTAPMDVFFKSDGLEMYVLGDQNNSVYQYNLTTAWDISTASYDQSFSVGSQDTSPQSIHFKSDGTKMFMVGLSGKDLNEYNLSTAWDISTASYSQNKTVDTMRLDGSGGGQFKPDGTAFFTAHNGSAEGVFKHDLSTAWDVSTMTSVPATTDFFVFTDFFFAVQGMFMSPDGDNFYWCDDVFNSVKHYSLSTAWDVSTLSSVGSKSVGSEDGKPFGVFFKTDGTKMYLCGNTNDTIYQYTLSTAWTVSTASYDSVSFSVNTQEANPQDVCFKTDGTKMYVLGQGSDAVSEYDLSTAWDISTASYNQQFVNASNLASATQLRFKPDGLRMYAATGASSITSIREFRLTTAWDVSTASFHANSSQNFSFFSRNIRGGMEFKSDGKKLVTLDLTTKQAISYTLEQ